VALSLDALIFDFDGVLVDSEPTHLACYQQVLAGIGVTMTRDEYYSQYLGYDDHDCFVQVLRDKGRPASPEQISDLIARKTVCVQDAFRSAIRALPGAVELVNLGASAGLPMAICSGALRREIQQAGGTIGISDRIMIVVAAEDVSRGKPDPQGYQMALEQLSQLAGRVLRAEKTVVVEDSPAGIASGKAAGMKVLAVATSYPQAELTQADKIVVSLAGLSITQIEKLTK
jgi:beta-phosphoglucomutase